MRTSRPNTGPTGADPRGGDPNPRDAYAGAASLPKERAPSTGFNVEELKDGIAIRSASEGAQADPFSVEVQGASNDQIVGIKGRITRIFSPVAVLQALQEVLQGEDKARITVNYPLRNSASIKDGATGFVSGAVLSDQTWLDSLSKDLGGSVMMYVVDVNNLGIPNKAGRSKDATEFIRRLGRCADEAFRNLPHRSIRLGGDEFAFFLPNNEAAAESFQKFNELVREESQKLFPPSDSSTIKMQQIATVREMAKQLRQEYLGYRADKREPLDYRLWLLCNKVKNQNDRANISGVAKTPQAVQQIIAVLNALGGNRDANRMTHSDAEERQYLLRRTEILSLTSATRALTRSLTPAIIANSLNLLNETINAKKSGAVILSDQSSSDNRQASGKLEEDLQRSEQRHYTLESLSRAVSGTKNVPDLLETATNLARLRKLEVRDPCLDLEGASVTRFNLARDRSAQELTGLARGGEHTVLTFEINHFGAINHIYGPERADQVISEVAEILTEDFPDSTIIRSGGGELHVILDTRVSASLNASGAENGLDLQVRSLITRFNSQLQLFNSDKTLLYEVAEKEQLRLLIEINREKNDVDETETQRVLNAAKTVFSPDSSEQAGYIVVTSDNPIVDEEGLPLLSVKAKVSRIFGSPAMTLQEVMEAMPKFPRSR